MPPSVDDLRTELKSLGYLSHGLERWFARDPWKSGTFWTELAIVSSKASLVIALFATAAAMTVMIARNGGLPLLESAIISAIYLASAFIGSIVVHVLVALALKWNPEFGIENPRALMVVAMALSGFFALWLVAWSSAFPSEPALPEQIAFAALLILLFAASSVVISAALLSFSIHETHSIPRIHRRSRTIPLTVGAALLLLLILGLSLTDSGPREQIKAAQVVVAPSDAKIALVAVDGLTPELVTLRPELSGTLALVGAESLDATSAPEAWATIGTGTGPLLHGVRSVEGIRFSGRQKVIQHVSQLDHGLRVIAPLLGIAERQPLPPSVRNRDYVWETLAKRGVASVAINWWTSDEASRGALRVTSQETIFTRASSGVDEPAALALEIDRLAIAELLESVDQRSPRFATVYLPALDVILNRLEVGESTRLAGTITALGQIAELVDELKRRGWSIVLIGSGGEADHGAVIGTTLEMGLEGATLHDIAPTLLALYGFPPSLEMQGEPLVPAAPYITSYGARESTETRPVSDDYYENLKSLGYIQ